MDRKKVKKDIVMWSIFLLLGLGMIFLIIPAQIPVSAMLQKEYITPRTFPTAVCAVLAALSAVGLIDSVRKLAKLEKAGQAQEAGKTREERYDDLFPLLIFALILAYALMFKYLGFVWATLVVPPIILYLLRCRKWYMYLAVYIFAAVVYGIFTLVLHVPLP